MACSKPWVNIADPVRLANLQTSLMNGPSNDIGCCPCPSRCADFVPYIRKYLSQERRVWVLLVRICKAFAQVYPGGYATLVPGFRSQYADYFYFCLVDLAVSGIHSSQELDERRRSVRASRRTLR